jgi:eukaryotic-like serine/threonine-protein kinase
MGRTGQEHPSRIGDRYRLVEKLGTGGMSVVWRGFDGILGRPVAVKVLSAQFAGDDRFRDRLRQEALAAARLSHPHITGIFDLGEAPLSGGRTVPYVVMELNDGESVAARLRRHGPMPWRESVTMVAEVASALATAHAQGVVHRDVTPANVMLTGAGAKVVDFGISALIGQRDAAPDGSLLGTPAYLAPERLGGGQVTAATDVYGIGLLLYRCLTARLPWPAENTTEALRAHLYADPKPLPSLPGLPAEVALLCLTCLAKNPADRPSAERVAAVLGRPPVLRRRTRSLGGGRLTRHLSVVAGRHRLQAAVAAVMLVAVAGLSWSAAREPPEAGPAQAAAGAVARVLHRADCKVRYQVRRDSGDDFAARLTVVNIGAYGLTGWRLEFGYPGRQRLSRAGPRVEQTGRTVVIRAPAGKTLAAGRSSTTTLRGDYREANALPLAFALNGRPCEAEVIGATTGGLAQDTPRQVAEAAGPRRRPS